MKLDLATLKKRFQTHSVLAVTLESGRLVAYGARCQCQITSSRARNRRHDQHRPMARQRGYTREREALRVEFLRLHPICALAGCGAPSEHVDHIKAHQGDKALVSTGPELHAVHIANYHRMMMGRAAASIDLVPSSERDISSLTMCVGEDGVRRLKERIQRFRRELLELTLLEDDPRQVVQVNFQLFPLTREPEDA